MENTDGFFKERRKLIPWKNGSAYNITFIVTEDCNLRCKYCYQVHKNNKKSMSLETAKKAVDYFLENRDIFNAEAVIWDFIGGEPLLEIDLIDEICDYIKIRSYASKHPWFNMYRFSFSTNGILYNHVKFKNFIKKNKKKSSVGITIDGTKRKHDLQRIYPDGRGSYDDVAKNIPIWLSDYPFASTKITISHEDLPYIKESVSHLWNLGIKNIPANIVFEDVWQNGDDALYEQQLRSLADYIIESELFFDLNCTLFDDTIGYPNDEGSLNKNHCGAGLMIAVDADGNLYPCLRYVDYSLTNQEPYIIGNIFDGIDSDKIRPFYGLTTKTQSDTECIDCEIAYGCAWCQGNNYDTSDSGTNYHRPKSLCNMHKARVRANNYYWRRLEREYDIVRTPVVPKKRHLFIIQADDSIEHCNYYSNPDSNVVISNELFEKALIFCDENFYKPVILHSIRQKEIPELLYFAASEVIDIVPAGHNISPKRNFYQVLTLQTINELCNSKSVIFNIEQGQIPYVSQAVTKILLHTDRINLNIRNSSKQFDFDSYQVELKKIVEVLISFYRNNVIKEINVITDKIYLNQMDNCEFGNYNFALGPNGKFYVCPSFYFNEPNSDIGSLQDGIKLKNPELFQLQTSPVCSGCEIYHCDRCVYLNKLYTNEYNTPSAFQCKKSFIERSASQLFSKRLTEESIHLENANKVIPINYKDPIEKILSAKSFNPYNYKSC